MSLTSSRPYLIRAVYEWLADNGLTPQIVVDVAVDGVQVPTQYIEDGRIVLNISSRAVRDLALGNERIEFNARFGGQPFQVVLPTVSVLALVARETGVGMSFPAEDPGDEPPEEPPPSPESDKLSKPTLRVVK